MNHFFRVFFLLFSLAGINFLSFGQAPTGTQWPITTTTPFTPSCAINSIIGGSASTGYTTNQYSLVAVTAGYQYNFVSLNTGNTALGTDYVTITNSANTQIYLGGLNGTSGIYWTATITGTIRFYAHVAINSTTSAARRRKVVMAPFQATISTVNSLCSGAPGTGQYTITVGPNHWSSQSYNVLYNGLSVIGYGTSPFNPEICSTCPTLVNSSGVPFDASTWSGTTTLTPPFTGHTFVAPNGTSSSNVAGTNSYTTSNIGSVGTYSSDANIVGGPTNLVISVQPSGSLPNTYTAGCGAYVFYPTITAPPNIIFLQQGQTNYSCGTGSIVVKGTGGVPPYNISWTDGTTAVNPPGNEILASNGTYAIPNLVAGTYTLTLTDANGCIKTFLVTIIPPPPPGPPTAIVSAQPSCTLATGTITVTDPIPGTGITYTVTGTAPLVAAQSNSTGVFPNLAPGVYAVTSSLNGCASPVVTLTIDPQPSSPPAPLASVTQQTNCTLSTGTITVSTPTPGAGITYSLTGTNPVLAPVTNTLGVFPSLSPGIYELVVSLNGCNTTPISLTVNPQPITPAAPIASVTEQPNCTISTGTITVTDPPNSIGITYTVAGTNPILVPITSGTGIFSNLASGIYDVTTSANGCTSPAISLTINPQPITPLAPTASVTEQPNCLLSTGTVTVSSPANGVGISYTVTGTNPVVPAQNNDTGVFPNLTPGIYDISTSLNGCISPAISLTVNPQPPTPVAPTASVTEQPTCLVETGTITVTSPINSPGVSYTLTGINPVVAAQTNFTGIFLFLYSGIYEVTTTSIDGCVSPAISLTVDPQPLTPAEPIANVTEQPTCFFPSGTITVTSPANGVGISYTLTGTNPVVTSQTNSIGIFSGLSSGIYDVTTTSANGCTSLAVSLTINPQPITPITPTVDTTAATCSADATAAITNYVGTQSYIFTPSGPTVDVSGAISNMLTGTSYTVISDNGECLSLESAPFVIDPQLITPQTPTVDTTAATCSSDGTATITNYDGTQTYTFTPSGPMVDATGAISNLIPTTTFTVKCFNGFCISPDSPPFVIDPQLIVPTGPIVDTTAATCSSDGTAAITNYDATFSYIFTPTGPTVDASGIISNMVPGTSYTVISDNGQCLSLESAPFVIDPQMITPAAPTASVIEQPTCTLSTGTIEVSIPTNGIGIMYTVTGSNPILPPQTNDTGVFPNLTPGIYDITTSLYGCISASISLEILPQPGIFTSSMDTTICPNNLPFSIYSLTFTIAETQVATLTSIDGCDSLVTINLFLEPLITSLVDTTICSNNLPFTINSLVFTTPGTQIATFSAVNGCDSLVTINVLLEPLITSIVDTAVCSSNLPFTINSLIFTAAGTQVANLTAVNGCDSLVTINVSVITNDNSLFTQIPPVCFGDQIILPTTSTNGFSGTWSPAINNTDTTTYTFTPGIDQCSFPATMTIIVYPQALVTITDTSICTGGTATLVATGTPAGGSYFWSNANPTSTIIVSPNFTTTYNVFYTSLNNCFATASRILAVNPIPTLTATSDVICDGEIATIVANGLPAGGTYFWTPGGETTASINISPTTTSNYSVIYTRFGCESPEINTIVTVNPVPIVDLPSEIICIGEDVTMTAQATIAGGVYDWGNGNSNETQTFNPLVDTSLNVTYTLNGCTSPIETATITVNPLPISTFSGSPLAGCIPLETVFLADDNSNTTYSWSADNGLTATGAQASLTFQSGGAYDITLTAGLNGCYTTTTINDYVTVDNFPTASFMPSSNTFSDLSQLISFTNSSTGATSYSWDFGDGAYSTEENPEYFFTNNLNGHVITLTAYSPLLCADVSSIEILYNDGVIYYIPNTFTPNGDEFNQAFKPIFSNSIDVYNYSMFIYNRWGAVIFETHDVKIGWDGSFGDEGIMVPDGTYQYKIIVKIAETDERKEFFGHLNVLR